MKLSRPQKYEVIDRGKYELILGSNATEIFKRYNVKEMHGLSLRGAEKALLSRGAASFIHGWANYNPYDKELSMVLKPFLFLNIAALQEIYIAHDKFLLIMHETMHMSGRLYRNRWDSLEEEMISWAECEASSIINLLTSKNYL